MNEQKPEQSSPEVQSVPDTKEELQKLVREQQRLLREQTESLKGYAELFKMDGAAQRIRKAAKEVEIKGGFYYREAYANALKPVIDQILEQKKSKLLLYSDYDDMSPETLRISVLQAFKYLVDTDNTPDSKYKIARDYIKVKKTDKYIMLQYLSASSLQVSKVYKAHDVNEEDTAEWKMKLFDFIETASDKEMLELDGLALTVDQIEWVKSFFADKKEEFTMSVKPNKITVVKFPEAGI